MKHPVGRQLQKTEGDRGIKGVTPSKRTAKLISITSDVAVAAHQSRQARQENDHAFLTPEQFAGATGLSIYTVRAWMRQDIIVSLPVGVTGRVRRIPAGEVERITSYHGNSAPSSVHEQR